MERTKYKKPSLILTSDWHLREDTPICFTGDFQKEQWEAVEYVKGIQLQWECPVIHAGDLFHHWKPSPALLSQAMWFLPQNFKTIYGQHDLPAHNWNLREKSGLHTLKVAGVLNILPGCHYGQEPTDPTIRACEFTKQKNILVWHHLTYINKPYPEATGGMAEGILRKYPQFSLICTGDNHQSFSTEYQGRLLVNPGNLTRQTADQADYQPRVALWYAETNTIEWVNIPIQQGVISREHLDRKEERDQRIDAFISKLSNEYEIGLSFEQNLNTFFEKNNIKDTVKELIFKAIEK